MTRMGSVLERTDVRIPGIHLPLMSVSQTRGVVRRSDLTDKPQRAESLDAYKVCRHGEIVFNKMSVRAGALGLAPEDGLVTYHYEVMRIRDPRQADGRFLVYLMKSDWFIGELIARERGIGAGDSTASVRTTEVPFKVLRTIDAYLPDAQEQRAIADYLDRETAQIDALISKQEQLIPTLEERFDAAWAGAYDEAAQLGSTVALRRVIESIADGPFGSSLTSSHYTDTGARVIRLGNIGINEFRLTDEAYISLDYYAQLSAHSVAKGDVIVAGLGDERMPLGRAAVVPDLGPAIVKADCYRLRPTPAVSAAYLSWALSAPQTREQFKLLSRGATRSRLNTSVVLEATIPVPSRSQQDALLTESRMQTAKIDALIAKAQQFIALAKERRAALITAAVTGQIDVTTGKKRAA